MALISGVLAAIWSIWFIAAFGPWMASLGEWRGIEDYAAKFEPLPYLAWVVPCLLLAVTFPIFLTAVHAAVDPARRHWSRVALVFGAIYGGVLTVNYWVVGTVVRSALEAGDLDGLEWLVIGNPHAVTGALEGIGYGFMGIAALFAGFAFAAGWTRWMFVANGVFGLAGVVMLAAGEALPDWLGVFGWVSLGGWNVTFPIAVVLGGLSVHRATRTTDDPARRLERQAMPRALPAGDPGPAR